MKLRTKTISKLSEDTCRALAKIIEDFIKEKNDEKVRAFIWYMTYVPVIGAKTLGLPEEITAEEILICRNEIASKYRSVRRNWIYGRDGLFDAAYAENSAYEALKKVVSDPYALYEVVEACEEYKCLDAEACSKTIACLRSTWATSHEKGFKRLGFTCEEQEYFMKARKEIASFFESLCSDKLEKEARNVSVAVVQRKGHSNVKAPAEQQDTATEVISGMTAQEILSQKEKIQEFFKACDEVANPEWLIKNRADIQMFLEASNKF